MKWTDFLKNTNYQFSLKKKIGDLKRFYVY